jgi:hypothetical protein
MGTVMIRCPKTGHAVSTGIDMEAPEFERLPTVHAELNCSRCGERHGWTKREAWLAETSGATGESRAQAPAAE